jgi:hypothetical protein
MGKVEFSKTTIYNHFIGNSKTIEFEFKHARFLSSNDYSMNAVPLQIKMNNQNA